MNQCRRLAAIALTDGNELFKVHLESGRTLTFTTNEAANLYSQQSGEKYEVKCYKSSMISGTAEQVKRYLNVIIYKVSTSLYYITLLKMR